MLLTALLLFIYVYTAHNTHIYSYILWIFVFVSIPSSGSLILLWILIGNDDDFNGSNIELKYTVPNRTERKTLKEF